MRHESSSAVYTAPSEEAGRDALKNVMDLWPQYKAYLRSWEMRWTEIAPFFGYPQPIRRMIYTTNAIENLNRQFRKVTKTTSVFPHDESLIKLLWLAQTDLAQRWTNVIRGWVKPWRSLVFCSQIECNSRSIN